MWIKNTKLPLRTFRYRQKYNNSFAKFYLKPAQSKHQIWKPNHCSPYSESHFTSFATRSVLSPCKAQSTNIDTLFIPELELVPITMKFYYPHLTPQFSNKNRKITIEKPPQRNLFLPIKLATNLTTKFKISKNTLGEFPAFTVLRISVPSFLKLEIFLRENREVGWDEKEEGR